MQNSLRELERQRSLPENIKAIIENFSRSFGSAGSSFKLTYAFPEQATSLFELRPGLPQLGLPHELVINLAFADLWRDNEFRKNYLSLPQLCIFVFWQAVKLDALLKRGEIIEDRNFYNYPQVQALLQTPYFSNQKWKIDLMASHLLEAESAEL